MTDQAGRGALVYEQPRREVHLQRILPVTMSAFFTVFVVAFLATSGIDGWPGYLLLGIMVVSALLFGLMAVAVRPIRLYAGGLEFASWFNTRFWPYPRIRDAQLARDARGRATLLFVTREDGTVMLGGGPWSSDVDFSSWNLEHVAKILRGGIKAQGVRPTPEWSRDALERIEPLLMRRTIRVRLEKIARERGIGLINWDFVIAALEDDRALRRWCRASEAARKGPTDRGRG